ncbi:protein STRUBBELIG-RECEPTOR FAMILY 2-like isoform X2 [Wolffia australiana]
MEGQKLLITPLLLFLFASFLVSAETDPLDVAEINALYRALNCPPQLNGWKSEGGDPCGGEPWKGVSCSDKSIVSIKIKGLGVDGQLLSNFSRFKNLTELDVSENSIRGQIPDSLPLNATNLNLSHNSLFGHIGNIFTYLKSLEYLDLSFNNFSGDLPSSITSLTKLHGLYLQENNFTGSVSFLVSLPLTSLNIENNHFSGVVPKRFESIPELKISGNMFQASDISFPPQSAEYLAPASSIHHPPSQIFSLIHRCDASNSFIAAFNCRSVSSFDGGQSRERPKWGIAAYITGGLASMGLIAAVVFVLRRRSHKYRTRILKLPRDPDIPLHVADTEGGENLTEESASVSSRQTRSSNTTRRKFSLRRLTGQPKLKYYSASELLLATKNFDEKNFLGSSLFCTSYLAEFLGGQTGVVRRLEIHVLSKQEEEVFMEFVDRASRLKHPNIVRLVGCSAEHGEYLTVHEYVKSWSLEHVLHASPETRRLLSWRARIKIALCVARALEHLHWASSAAMAHENLTAASVLVDERLVARLDGCGLAMLRPLANMDSWAFAMARARTGYTAPEFGRPGTDGTKCDVFSFGVLLLELLTGRKPSLEISRREQKESLVTWASSRLHDIGMLEDMTDPAIRSDVTGQSLSQFADIVLPCIQVQPEFRPAMGEVEDQLSRLLSKIRRPPRGVPDALDLSSIRVALSNTSSEPPIVYPIMAAFFGFDGVTLRQSKAKI